MDRVVHNMTLEGRVSGGFGRPRAAVGFSGVPFGARGPCIGLSSDWNC